MIALCSITNREPFVAVRWHGLAGFQTDKSRACGAANPQITYTIAGFIGSDKPATGTSGQPTLGTTADSVSNAGPYPITITVGTLNAANYDFSFAGGTLTVTRADQTIAFGALANKTYGDVPFKLSATASSGLPVTF